VPAKTIAARFKKAALKNLRYYNPDIATGAFALPNFVRKLIPGLKAY
jgi:spermidine synthase